MIIDNNLTLSGLFLYPEGVRLYVFMHGTN